MENQNGPLPIKSIVKFFAFTIMAFGIILFGEGAYSLFKPNLSSSNTLDNTVPEVQFAKDGNNATISITHNKGIARVKYYWNDGEEKIVSGKSEKEVVLTDLSIPAGVNTLYVEAIDDNGKSAEVSHEYSYEGTAIEFASAVNNNSEIKFVATDVTGIAYIKYRWNSDEEITVYPKQEGDIFIEHSTEIPVGLNTLYVTAVNSSNMSVRKEQQIRGNKRPEIAYYIQDKSLYVTVTDAEGIESISCQINASEPEVFEPNGEKEYKFNKYIGDESIVVTITAKDVYGATKTLKGKNY